ncbi:hypothetical protein GCM10010411_64130 [Actinomadura fulvescens]|uniref:Uncharacterized protein n=1 Tax=Actinomadura fulvescens TaxID=46160 RepID=A0ABP6CMN3_9ACTN
MTTKPLIPTENLGWNDPCRPDFPAHLPRSLPALIVSYARTPLACKDSAHGQDRKEPATPRPLNAGHQRKLEARRPTPLQEVPGLGAAGLGDAKPGLWGCVRPGLYEAWFSFW